MADTIYWIWLAECLGPGSRHLHYLLDRYSSPYEIFRAESEEIDRLELGSRVINALSKKDMRNAYAINDHCVAHNIGILTYDSEFYPSKLRLIADPPAVLYYIGELPNMNDNLSIGIVGTRTMSEYGKASAYKIAYELASAGVTVVSGMALGVDGVASCAAIMGGGKTVAVLGSGVDVVYPKEHRTLYDRIIKNGAVISEYPPTTGVRDNHFPVRNRIISGMTSGTLIVECDMISGAMITARRAIEQGKDIFALPGNLDNKNSNGTNMLIHDGAQMVLETSDILKAYEFYYGKSINYLGFSMSRGHSDLDEYALSEMKISAKGNALSFGKKKEKPQNTEDDENVLRPRNIPKNKSVKEMPSTLKKKNKKLKDEEIFVPETPKKSTEEELASLSAEERAILAAMPDDRAVSVDELSSTGLECQNIMSSLAMLEIEGIVSSLPGGLYIKN